MVEYENLSRLNKPFIAALKSVFDRALDEGKFILGKEVLEFEREFAAYCGTAHCIGVGNGLDALTLALRCFEFNRGAEVIVPSNTYMASILAIINCGLRPVLIEPDLKTYNLDPSKVEDAITSKTAAIMVVHLYGKCCSMEDVLTIGNKYHLRIIEDCAHAHGARYRGRMAGTFGDLGAYSFFPTKNLGALGDGGGLVTNDSEFDRRIRLLRNYGSVEKDVHEIVGFNSRLDELQAGFLRIKLESLDKMNQRRRSIASTYAQRLGDRFIIPADEKDYFDVFHVFNIRYSNRDRLRKYLIGKGIETKIHYPTPPHRQAAWRHLFGASSFPISELIHETTLSLPVSPIHDDISIDEVIQQINSYA